VARSHLMRRLGSGAYHKIDWHYVQVEGRKPVVLLDPFGG
jgi:hypothetical protein